MTKDYSFGFDRCATPDQVRARMRKLAKILHPDAGGDDELFAAANAEAERRLEEIANPEREPRHAKERRRHGHRSAPPLWSGIATALLNNPDVQSFVIEGLMRHASADVRKTVMSIADRISKHGQ